MAGLKYIGKGAFVAGFPARDLSPEDVERYGAEAYLEKHGLLILPTTQEGEPRKNAKPLKGKAALLATGLYEEAPEAKADEKKDAGPEEASAKEGGS